VSIEVHISHPICKEDAHNAGKEGLQGRTESAGGSIGGGLRALAGLAIPEGCEQEGESWCRLPVVRENEGMSRTAKTGGD
jgi:hypothetical protein